MGLTKHEAEELLSAIEALREQIEAAPNKSFISDAAASHLHTTLSYYENDHGVVIKQKYHKPIFEVLLGQPVATTYGIKARVALLLEEFMDSPDGIRAITLIARELEGKSTKVGAWKDGLHTLTSALQTEFPITPN